MSLKPQDVMVLLKLIALEERKWSYRQLASELAMGLGEVHSALRRASEGGLARKLENKRVSKPAVDKWVLFNFIMHGVPHVFPAKRGMITIGMPTGFAAPQYRKMIVLGDIEIPVWPHPHGKTKGYELKPLYKTAVFAAEQDENLYDLLALVDAVRDGRARERKAALELLSERFNI